MLNGAFALRGIFLVDYTRDYIQARAKICIIEGGHCCQSKNHPDRYGLCYDEGVELFETEGWTNCSKLGYYITGFYRGSGDWLKNINKFRCCQMDAGNY